MSTALHSRHAAPAGGGPGDRARTVIRTAGELFITAGMVMLLFVGYSVYWTDVVSAGKQREATSSLDARWADPTVEAAQQRRGGSGVPLGDGFAKLYIPSFGPDYQFTVLQGTSEEALEAGPGHYPDTALPGETGNFAVAGHRVGKGAPFNDLDLLRACDALVVETAQDWFVYRVLPMDDDPAGAPGCAGAPVLGDTYPGVYGREIVDPSDSAVINPVPDAPQDAVPTASLLTLTTCHPRFSARERMIVHASLVRAQPKDAAGGDGPPAELAAG